MMDGDEGVPTAPVARTDGGTDDGLRASVERIVADRLRVERAAVSPDARLADDLGADSLDVVEIAEAIDAELGVHLRDEDLDRAETVGDLLAAVRERQ